MILKTEAIVLKAFDYRETSRIVTLFGREAGKMSGVLKGIRKDPRKFGSSVDRFSVNEIVYYPSRRSDLHLISQCDLKQYFWPVRRDLKKAMAASYALELVGAIMPVEEPNRKVYQLMLDFLTGLETARDIDALVHFLQIKMLALSGFQPHLDACLKCRRQIRGRARFSLRDGGLVCSQCPVTGTDAPVISPGTVASILHTERHEWDACLKLRLTSSVRGELKYLLNNFLVFHLGRRLRSAKYIQQA